MHILHNLLNPRFMASITRYTLTIILILFFACPVLAATPNLSNAFGDTSVLTNVAKPAGYDTEQISIGDSVAIIIQTALSLVGVVFLILMVYGGFLWMTAHGSEEQVTKSKNLITAALIGLVIVLSAYAISVFVITKLGDNMLTTTTSSE